MIARPKISRNEWKTAEIGAFEVGNVALFSCPARDARDLDDLLRRAGHGHLVDEVRGAQGRGLEAVDVRDLRSARARRSRRARLPPRSRCARRGPRSDGRSSLGVRSTRRGLESPPRGPARDGQQAERVGDVRDVAPLDLRRPFESSTRLTRGPIGPFRHGRLSAPSSARREPTTRPETSRIDFDSAELERFEARSGPPRPAVERRAGRDVGDDEDAHLREEVEAEVVVGVAEDRLLDEEHRDARLLDLLAEPARGAAVAPARAAGRGAPARRPRTCFRSSRRRRSMAA